MKIRTIVFAAVPFLALAACSQGYGYSDVSVGYGTAGYYGDFYDGAYGAPYYGWNSGYYYPGSGYYVYDQQRRPMRWTDGQRRYWQGRGNNWRGQGARNEEWRGFDRGPSRGGGDGYRGQRGRQRR
ncbi:hypothetical protein [uncultured Sphingomonas sp.]|uniref:hypothetical protein n=1 Tax=uncultured Sphingomonas sp. TaxID=158754 RepID=UPI0035CA907B